MKMLGHIPTCRGAGEIDIGEYQVDLRLGVATSDRLFATSGFDNDIPGLTQAAGYLPSQHEFVLDHENNQSTIVCR